MTALRAAVLPNIGAALQIQEFPDAPPGPGVVAVDVTHAGICGTDVHLQDGRMAIPTPLVLGHEAVGRVAAVGEGVTHDALGQPLRAGDAVTWASSIPCGRCYYCVREGERSLCEQRKVYGISRGAEAWPNTSGGWADRLHLQPGSTIVRLPEGVTTTQVVALGCAGPTIVHGLLGVARPEVGDTVVVQGSGPVGLAAAMYARLAGARRVILVGGPRNRLDLAGDLGVCDTAIDIFTETDPSARLRQVLAQTPAGRGADLVVEATGVPSAVDEGLRMCRRNGRYLVVGQYTDHGPAPLNPHLITFKQLRVLGSWAFAADHYVDYVATIPQLTERFDVERLVTTYELAQVNQALADMRSGAALKPVLRGAAG